MLLWAGERTKACLYVVVGWRENKSLPVGFHAVAKRRESWQDLHEVLGYSLVNNGIMRMRLRLP